MCLAGIWFTRRTQVQGWHCKPSAEDPQPDLAACLCNRPYVEKLVKGLKNTKKEGAEETVPSETPEAALAEAALREVPQWQPETLFRTTISSLVSSEEFGPMMAAEADARGFYTAQKKAFLGDGLLCNWRIQERWFPDFTCIADFIHVVEHIYEVAKAVHADADQHWQQYVTWATGCWQGRVFALPPRRVACHEFPGGVACQANQSTGQRNREVLERRSDGRGHPATAGRAPE